MLVLLHISPYSIRMRENADQNNSEYGHFLRSVLPSYKYQSIDLLYYHVVVHYFRKKTFIGNVRLGSVINVTLAITKNMFELIKIFARYKLNM